MKWLGLLNFEEVWAMKRTAIERWAQKTTQERVKLYLQEVLGFVSFVEKWMYPDLIMHRLLDYMAFEFEGKQPPEVVEMWIKKKDKWVWADIEYAREKGIFDVLELLHKAYDKELLDVLREDYEKTTRILRQSYTLNSGL